MPASKRPSFLKRQKELKRMERAAEKREAKRMKKASRLDESNDIAEGEASDSAIAGESDEGEGRGEIQH